MQTVNFEIFGDGEFYCPATGQPLLGKFEFEKSPATEFVFLDEIGEFEFITPELEEKFEAMDTADDEWELDRFERFAESIQDHDLVCFCITQCGMACGPVSSTVRIAIRMNYANCTDEPAE